MSDYFSNSTGYRRHHHHHQPQFHHSFNPNALTNMTFAFNTHYHFSHPFVFNGGGDLLHHRHPTNNTFFEVPSPNTNMRIGTCGRGGVKLYLRFHGGIGDGCCGIACRNIMENTIARPLQLFDALDPINFQIPMIGQPVVPEGTSSGTGVFLPVYQKRKIRAIKGMHVRGGRRDEWGQLYARRMKQEDTIPKRFARDVKKEECNEVEEIPIELLLPSEWTY